jgi:tetratricopeptide (TPR) repeat protein
MRGLWEGGLDSVGIQPITPRGAGRYRLPIFFTALALAFPLSLTWAGTAPLESGAIRILVVMTEADARAAVADLNAGVPFERLVRERSIGPEKGRGGYLGRVSPDSLSLAARAALAKTPPGRVSPIFPTEGGFALIQVLTSMEERELEARIRQEPEARELLRRGTDLGQAGDLEGAEAALRRATELNPDLVDAHYNLAIIYRRRQQPDAAITAMKRVIQLHPEDFDAHLRLGAWLFERGQYGESCDEYERAATLRMDSREAWVGLARSYEAAGRARAAVAAYRRAITLLDSDDPAVVGGLFRTAMQAQDGPTAVAAARKLKPFRPGHEGFVMLGNALLLNGEVDAAIQEYQKAAALAPSSAATQAALGSAYAKAGQADAAVERFLRAVQLDPGNPTFYRLLARLYEGQGRLDLAIVALRDGVAAAAAVSRKLGSELANELAALYDRAGMSREAEMERLRAKSLQTP